MKGGLRTIARLVAAACALSGAACDDGEPAPGIESRVTFVIAAPTERFRHLSAEISYPESAKPTGGDDCHVSRYFEKASFDDSSEGVISVALDAYDMFPPSQGLPPVDHGEEGDDDYDDLASWAQTIGEEGFEFRAFECGWTADTKLEAKDFAIEVIEATDASGSELTPTPDLLATSVFTEFDTPNEAEPAYRFDVYVAVTNAVGRLGGLQFDIVFLGNDGGWFGGFGSVQCSTLSHAQLSTYNNKNNGVLSGAMVDLEGIETPGEVTRCTFGMDMPALPEYFAVDVVDAADVEGSPPPEDPVMEVTRIVLLNPDNVRAD